MSPVLNDDLNVQMLEYCLLCTAGRGTLDVEDVEDVEDVADVEDVKDVEDRTWRT